MGSFGIGTNIKDIDSGELHGKYIMSHVRLGSPQLAACVP